MAAQCIEDQCLDIALEQLKGYVGDKKAIYCEGTHLSPSELEWYDNNGDVVGKRSSKNNRVYVEGRNAKDPNKGLLVLIIFSMTLPDTGNWTCKGKKLNLQDQIYVEVGVKATVDAPEENKKVEAGKNAKLSCKVEGVPKPIVQWYNNDLELIGSDERFILSESNTDHDKSQTHTLEIKKVTYQDAGKYLCKVTQQKISHFVHKVITLEVLHAPILFDSETLTPLDIPPRSKTEEAIVLKEVFVVANETKILPCNAIANPVPEFRWYKIGEHSHAEIIKDKDLIQSDTFSSNLTIILRTPDDSRKYKCVVDNRRGKVALEYHISLGEKPMPPNDIKFVSANSSHINFEVTCTNCTLYDKETEGVNSPDPSDLPIKAYNFHLTEHKENYPADWENGEEIQVDIESPNITIFSVGPLANSTTFHVRVQSVNDAGVSDWLEMAESWLEKTKTSKAIQLASTLHSLATMLFVYILCF